jgi:hypothetical protein
MNLKTFGVTDVTQCRIVSQCVTSISLEGKTDAVMLQIGSKAGLGCTFALFLRPI